MTPLHVTTKRNNDQLTLSLLKLKNCSPYKMDEVSDQNSDFNLLVTLFANWCDINVVTSTGTMLKHWRPEQLEGC